MNDENLATRLKLFINKSGLTNSQFADKCDIPRPTLSQILTRRNKKVSDVLMGQIHDAFPELSLLWLMFGEGEMLANSNFSGSEISDNPDLPPFNGDDEEYLKENGLVLPSSSVFDADNENVSSKIRAKIMAQNSSPKNEKPRCVVQITVYYDDSTFETFYPKG